jgi:hypothetical protein
VDLFTNEGLEFLEVFSSLNIATTSSLAQIGLLGIDGVRLEEQEARNGEARIVHEPIDSFRPERRNISPLQSY